MFFLAKTHQIRRGRERAARSRLLRIGPPFGPSALDYFLCACPRPEQRQKAAMTRPTFANA